MRPKRSFLPLVHWNAIRYVVFILLLLLILGVWLSVPRHQVLHVYETDEGLGIQEIQTIHMSVFYRLMPPHRYIAAWGALGKGPLQINSYPGRILTKGYPKIIKHPDVVVMKKINTIIQELLLHPRGLSGSVDYNVQILLKLDGDFLELSVERRYYPFFAIRPMVDNETVQIEWRTGLLVSKD